MPAFAVFLATQRRAAASDHDPLVNIAVIAQRPVGLGLFAPAASTGTYYALLFSLAQYFQDGLQRSALASGLILVPWVAAFGLAGQVTRRLAPRYVRVLPVAGCVLLAAAYLAIGGALLSGAPSDAILVALLALGGFGLGTGFSTLIGHLTNAVPPRYAPDISGVCTTSLQIGGAIGVAAFGSLYLAQAATAGAVHARHAFALTCVALGITSVLAAGAAYLATHAEAAEVFEPSEA